MSGILGWIVAAVVIVAAGAYIWWPKTTSAPTDSQTATTTEQASGTSEVAGASLMAGLWQSTTDAKFTREIRPDGVMIDRYEGDVGAGTGGEWSVVNPEHEPMVAARAAALSGMTVVKVVWDGGVETTYFSINKVDAASMTTTDLTGQGSVTIYKKLSQLP